ncbi:MAG: DUF4861 domain-containing protein [Cyclobacteriaceae bacterium]|nr:DUF4861 domain-containing protein [Cyclobacteriaceae bacterium]
MKNWYKFLFVLLAAGVSCASPEEKEFPESFTVTVTNPASFDRNDVMVFIPANELSDGFNAKAFIVLDGKTEIASQYNLNDKDYPGIVLVLDGLQAGQSKDLTVRYNKAGESKRNYTKRTQAELSHKFGGEWKEREYIGGEFKNVEYLRVPPEHKDHSWFIRYEGPGWESDKVGYRFYLDQRNAVDVFGKKVPEPALQKAGLDGFDSYHEMQEWGMDVLKVAKSLGVGSIGYFNGQSALRVEITDSVDCRIVENGDVYSSILTNYYGWNIGDSKTDVASRLSIYAGSRLTQNLLTLSDETDNICSGLIKDPKGNLFTKEGGAESFGYIATYGKQSLNDDNLGIAVLFSAPDFIEFTEDEFSHIVKMKPSGGKLTYYFVAAWEGEPGGIKNEEEFISYLDQTAKELANPVKVEVK